MYDYLRFRYTSGFILTGEELVQLAQHLRLPYVEGTPEAWPPCGNAARLVSDYMSRCKYLEPFNLQTVSLYEENPISGSNKSPEIRWIIPTRRSRKNNFIDPLTHKNSKKVKVALMATGIPEEYLTQFQMYPNKEYPWTIITGERQLPDKKIAFSTSP